LQRLRLAVCLITLLALWQGASAADESVSIGIVLCPSQSLGNETQSLFADELCRQLALPERAEVMLLSPSTGIVRAAGVDITPVIADPPEAGDNQALSALPQALELDDVLVLQLSGQDETPGLRAHGLWVRAGVSGIKALDLKRTADDVKQIASATAEMVLAGFEKAADLVGPLPEQPTEEPAAQEPPPEPPEQPIPPVQPPEETVAPPTEETPPEPPSEEPTEPPAVETAPEVPEKSLLQQATMTMAEGDLVKALDLIDQALAEGADLTQAALLRSHIYELLGNAEKAREELASVVALDPGQVEATLGLAEMEAARGLWQRAIELCHQAIENDPSFVEGYLRLYELYRDHNQPRRALQIMEQGAEANPDSSRLFLRLGVIYQERELLAPAEAAFKQAGAMGDEGQQVEALSRLGDLYAQTGEFVAAFDAYVRAAQVAGVGGQVEPEGYGKIFAAADEAVTAVLETVWKPLTAFVEGGPVVREEAYAIVAQALAQLDEIRSFGQRVTPPAGRAAAHAQRQLYYQVAYEAIYSALLYLDTGDAELLANARARTAQAAKEQERISSD